MAPARTLGKSWPASRPLLPHAPSGLQAGLGRVPAILVLLGAPRWPSPKRRARRGHCPRSQPVHTPLPRRPSPAEPLARRNDKVPHAPSGLQAGLGTHTPARAAASQGAEALARVPARRGEARLAAPRCPSPTGRARRGTAARSRPGAALPAQPSPYVHTPLPRRPSLAETTKCHTRPPRPRALGRTNAGTLTKRRAQRLKGSPARRPCEDRRGTPRLCASRA